jgi:hypothetical protein
MDANARLVVYGTLSPQFPLQKSIHQGCPLAPFLYVLSVDALGYLLQHAQVNRLVHGISFPRNTMALNSHFVVDNMIFIQNSVEDVKILLDVLDYYCTVSSS